jgi:hypothetical protein
MIVSFKRGYSRPRTLKGIENRFFYRDVGEGSDVEGVRLGAANHQDPPISCSKASLLCSKREINQGVLATEAKDFCDVLHMQVVELGTCMLKIL